MANPIDNTEDLIDSRQIIERIAELEAQRDDDGDEEGDGLDDDEREELTKLQAFAEEANGLSDWSHGETLIRDSYFEDYARELASDIGAVNADAEWPNSYIDWERAAEALQIDYTSYEFDDVTYWARG